MKLRSIRFKVTILFTVILGIILSLYGGILYYSLYKSLYDELDRELERKAYFVASSMHSYIDVLHKDDHSLLFIARRTITLKGEYPGGQVDMSAEQKRKIVDLERKWKQLYDKLDLNEDFINFVKMTGKSLVKSQNVPSELRNILIKKMKGRENFPRSFLTFTFKKRNLRLIQVPFKYNGENNYLIQIASSQKPIVELLAQRQYVFMISIPIILILTSFIGSFFFKRILMPVAEVTETAKEITHENLKRRLKFSYKDEEMHVLVEAFNDMISRLDQAFQHISEFSSQVAHELKTPIAIIRGECEIALRKVRSQEEYIRALQVNLDEAQRMLKTIDDLLLLAKLDYRPEIFTFEEINVADFFYEIHEQSKILSSSKEIEVQLKMPIDNKRIRGDVIHLRRLFFNIIYNAIKFTPPKGKINIEILSHKESLHVAIEDSGPGIPSEYLHRVFDKFFHNTLGENDLESGSGLGLSIAQAIARIHGGSIFAQNSSHGGAVFTVTLPFL